MDAPLEAAYKALEEDSTDAIKQHRMNHSVISVGLNALLLYPDHPWNIGDLYGYEYNPETQRRERFLIATPEDLDQNGLYAMERRLIELVRAELAMGRRGMFRPEWANELASIPEVYICFNNDEAGRAGATRIGRLIPHARIIELPEEVGKSGDVTDFFVRLGKSRADFETLMECATPAPPSPPTQVATLRQSPDPIQRERIDHIKNAAPIAGVVERYVKLQKFGNNLVGLRPFHEDHNPSFTVFPANGSFHCFGCRKRGDVITFFREIEGLGFGQSLDRLEEYAGPEPHRGVHPGGL